MLVCQGFRWVVFVSMLVGQGFLWVVFVSVMLGQLNLSWVVRIN